jgi:hypothetical protein
MKGQKDSADIHSKLREGKRAYGCKLVCLKHGWLIDDAAVFTPYQLVLNHPSSADGLH